MNPLNLGSINLSGRNLIEASAGTGKTWTIAAIYILLLLEKELLPEQILVVTYTKAATAELRERIRARIANTLELFSGIRKPGDDQFEQLITTARHYERQRAKQLLTRALYSFDDAAIFTIHGFCQRTLMENAFESGALFGCDMISDQSAIIKQVCDDFWRKHIMSQSDDFIEHLAGKGFTPEKLAHPLQGHFQNPDLKIIPKVDYTPHEQLTTERKQLYENICSLWKNDRTAIVLQLEQARLNQQSYKPSQIAGAAQEFDFWVGRDSAEAPNNKLEFFSIHKIKAKATAATPAIPDDPFYSLCGRMLELNQSIEQIFSERIISTRIELKKWLEQQISLRKKTLNQRSFDDLLLDLHIALESESGAALVDTMQQRYKAAMIDEFQDTDPIQWNVFKHLGKKNDYPLFLIGDPKQAIYSFRGADVFAYLQAGKSVLSENTHTLNSNFRSDEALVRAVSTIFSAHANPFMIEEMSFQPVESGRSPDDCLLLNDTRDTHPLKVWLYRRDDDNKLAAKPEATSRIVQSVAREIVLLLSGKYASIRTSGDTVPLKAHDIAVLVKSHKQAERVQRALFEFGVPSVQQGSSTIFETPEALDLLKILRAVASPHKESAVREALLTACMGVNANQISSYVESSGDHPDWEKWLLQFDNLNTAAMSGGIVAVMSRLLATYGVREHLLLQQGGERSLTNLLHCCELLHQIEQEQGKNLSGLITWLEHKTSQPSRDDASLLRLETDENAVTISTIHASKGLQYPVVFVPFGWDASSAHANRTMFHDADGRLVLDLADADDNVQAAASEQQAEAARLLYVALTRAEFRCYVVWGAINGAAESTLCRLFHGNDRNVFAKLDDKSIANDIQKLSNIHNSGVAVEFMPVDTPVANYAETKPKNTPYTCRTPGRVLCDDWRVASFSGITSGAGHATEPRDHDSMIIDSTQTQPTGDGLSIFDFPRGARAGICLHEIFEHLDYSNISDQAITNATSSALAGSGFNDSWLPALKKMVANVTSAPILNDDPVFNLSLLAAGSWHTEMEFYLPVKHLSPGSITSLFGSIMDGTGFGDFLDVLGRLKFRESRGVLQGFIDLVFSYNDRYYIVDWKSNHLGMSVPDYNQESLHESMSRNVYILQYHLYTLALDRLLNVRLPGYRYETNFGGVLYLYVRGVTGSDPVHGIYRERPLEEFVRKANEIMIG